MGSAVTLALLLFVSSSLAQTTTTLIDINSGDSSNWPTVTSRGAETGPEGTAIWRLCGTSTATTESDVWLQNALLFVDEDTVESYQISWSWRSDASDVGETENAEGIAFLIGESIPSSTGGAGDSLGWAGNMNSNGIQFVVENDEHDDGNAVEHNGANFNKQYAVRHFTGAAASLNFQGGALDLDNVDSVTLDLRRSSPGSSTFLTNITIIEGGVDRWAGSAISRNQAIAYDIGNGGLKHFGFSAASRSGGEHREWQILSFKLTVTQYEGVSPVTTDEGGSQDGNDSGTDTLLGDLLPLAIGVVGATIILTGAYVARSKANTPATSTKKPAGRAPVKNHDDSALLPTATPAAVSQASGRTRARSKGGSGHTPAAGSAQKPANIGAAVEKLLEKFSIADSIAYCKHLLENDLLESAYALALGIEEAALKDDVPMSDYLAAVENLKEVSTALGLEEESTALVAHEREVKTASGMGTRPKSAAVALKSVGEFGIRKKNLFSKSLGPAPAPPPRRKSSVGERSRKRSGSKKSRRRNSAASIGGASAGTLNPIAGISGPNEMMALYEDEESKSTAPMKNPRETARTLNPIQGPAGEFNADMAATDGGSRRRKSSAAGERKRSGSKGGAGSRRRASSSGTGGKSKRKAHRKREIVDHARGVDPWDEGYAFDSIKNRRRG